MNPVQIESSPEKSCQIYVLGPILILLIPKLENIIYSKIHTPLHGSYFNETNIKINQIFIIFQIHEPNIFSQK